SMTEYSLIMNNRYAVARVRLSVLGEQCPVCSGATTATIVVNRVGTRNADFRCKQAEAASPVLAYNAPARNGSSGVVSGRWLARLYPLSLKAARRLSMKDTGAEGPFDWVRPWVLFGAHWVGNRARP